jgi:hypothetical protein
MDFDHLPILEEPPAQVPTEVWSALNDGERLRWLKAHRHDLGLTREQYIELANVPYWASYGPEHGLPPDLFNDRGFLLPKYRPGGGLHHQFRRWRQWYRRVIWLHVMLQRRVETFYRRSGFLIVVPLFASAFLIGNLLGNSLSNRWPQVPETLLRWAVVGLLWLVAIVLIRLAMRSVSWCISRRVAKTLPPPEDVTPNPSLQRTPPG